MAQGISMTRIAAGRHIIVSDAARIKVTQTYAGGTSHRGTGRQKPWHVGSTNISQIYPRKLKNVKIRHLKYAFHNR